MPTSKSPFILHSQADLERNEFQKKRERKEQEEKALHERFILREAWNMLFRNFSMYIKLEFVATNFINAISAISVYIIFLYYKYEIFCIRVDIIYYLTYNCH